MDYLPKDLAILVLNVNMLLRDDVRQGRARLRLVVVVPDKQGYASEGQQKLEGYDENVYHNG